MANRAEQLDLNFGEEENGAGRPARGIESDEAKEEKSDLEEAVDKILEGRSKNDKLNFGFFHRVILAYYGTEEAKKTEKKDISWQNEIINRTINILRNNKKYRGYKISYGVRKEFIDNIKTVGNKERDYPEESGKKEKYFKTFIELSQPEEDD